MYKEIKKSQGDYFGDKFSPTYNYRIRYFNVANG